jgi:dolichyl-phosphate beta-glucosyltransferase
VKLAIVIPAYNENDRFDTSNLNRLFELTTFRTRIYIINDGSTDGFPDKIKTFIENYPHLDVVLSSFQKNVGKSEALRFGCNLAIEDGFEFISIADADFSSPPEDILNLATNLSLTDYEIILGSRKKNKSNSIEKHFARYISGRVFSLLVQLLFRLNIYDTQCGYKTFRSTENLKDALKTKTTDPWLFDVEILVRMKKNIPDLLFLEVPLSTWIHKDGSKINSKQISRTVIALFKLKLR